MEPSWKQFPLREGTTLLTAIDAHTAGGPLRLITSGLPELSGLTILEKQRCMPTSCATRLLKRSFLNCEVETPSSGMVCWEAGAEAEEEKAQRAEQEEKRGKGRETGHKNALGEATLSEERQPSDSESRVKPSPGRARRQSLQECRTA